VKQILLGLAESSGVLSSMLSSEEMQRAANRIAEIAALEELGRSARAAASEVRQALAIADISWA
jgi:hypothetical protein